MNTGEDRARSAASTPVAREIVSYGPHERQVCEWFLPISVKQAPLVVVVHGGFWRPKWTREIEDATCLDLAEHGFAVCNIEYRAYDNPWPAIFADVSAGIAATITYADQHDINTGRSAILGHSAGGALALWAICQPPPSTQGPDQLSVDHPFQLAIASAPVACLTKASSERLGDGAVDHMMGGSATDAPQRYALTDPFLLRPKPSTVIYLLHGRADEDVPLHISEAYLEHARSNGNPGELIIFENDGHYEILDPTSQVSTFRRSLLQTLKD